MLGETLAEMSAEGMKRALAIVLAAYSSYSSCRQYREDIARAEAALGAGALRVDKVRVFYNHPEFIAANAERVTDAIERFSPHRSRPRLSRIHRTQYSVLDGADMRLRAANRARPAAWWRRPRGSSSRSDGTLVYQSRSGRPEDPWLGPDILDHLKDLKQRGASVVVIHPVGFLSDHLEVLYDLDVEARAVCDELGLTWFAAKRSACIRASDDASDAGRRANWERSDRAMSGLVLEFTGRATMFARRRAVLPRPGRRRRVGTRAEFDAALCLSG